MRVNVRWMAALLALGGTFACGDFWNGLTRGNERNCIVNPGRCELPLICDQATGDCVDPRCGAGGCADLAGVDASASDGSTDASSADLSSLDLRSVDSGGGAPADMIMSGSPAQVWAINASGELWLRTNNTWALSKATGSSTTYAGIWGASSTDVVAVLNTSVWQWNGSTWATVSAGASATLRAVCGAGTEVWAAQENKTILHRVGGAWSGIGVATGAFYSCWGVAGQGFVGGQSGEFMRCSGGSCTQESPRPVGKDLTGVWGSAATDLWVVSSQVSSAYHSTTANIWTGFTTSNSSYSGMWGSSKNDIWAVGSSGACARFNGITWGSCPAGLSGTLKGIWGSSSSDIWIVGDSGNVFHWNGTSYVTEKAGSAQLLGVWSTP